MLKYLLAAALLASAPAAFAQTNNKTGSSAGSSTAATPTPSGNLNNPQAEANMGGQPPNARSVPSDGDAKRIPIPEVNGQASSSRLPQAPKPSTSNAIR